MRRTPFIAGLIVLCGLGLLPRLWNLGAQVLGDDEVHSVRSALGRPVSHILVTYELTDNCIPLTAFWRMLLDAGVRPDEQMLRLPAVVSGALLLLVAPAWAAWRIGRGPALVFAGLLALSPGLVIYSRIARSYAPVVLLGFGAVAAFEAWWRRPSWRMGAVYVGLAALAAWFHLGAATFVVAPFLFAVADLLVHRTTQRLRALLGLGLATGLEYDPGIYSETGELIELGLHDALDKSAVRTRELAYFSKHGKPIWSEPRGIEAGYKWPQFSIHRGRLQGLLYAAAKARIGADKIRPIIADTSIRS